LRWTVEKIKSWLSGGMIILFFCPDQEALHRMKHMLLSYDVPAQTLSQYQSVLEILSQGEGKSQLILLEGEISTSFIIPDMNLVCLSEEEIFVKKAPRRRVRPTREGYFLKSFGDLKEGDFVVHTDFGIGIVRDRGRNYCAEQRSRK